MSTTRSFSATTTDWRQREACRFRAGRSRAGRGLAARNSLADGLAENDAADIIDTLMSPEVHLILTVARWLECRPLRTLAANALSTQLLPRERPVRSLAGTDTLCQRRGRCCWPRL
jgi:hypothetical protein